MNQTATITDKRQLTIPASVFRELGLREGDRVLVRPEEGRLVIEPMSQLVDQLAGSVVVPTKFRGTGVDSIIKHAKRERFRKRI